MINFWNDVGTYPVEIFAIIVKIIVGCV